MTTDETPFEIGKAALYYGAEGERADVGIIATGALVYKALRVAEQFKKEGVSAKVLNVATIKPLDTAAVTALAQECGALVTVEEHQVAGGLGSAVAEYLAEHFLVPIEFVGVRDVFGQSGTPDELLEHYGMGESHIEAAARRAIGRKK